MVVSPYVAVVRLLGAAANFWWRIDGPLAERGVDPWYDLSFSRLLTLIYYEVSRNAECEVALTTFAAKLPEPIPGHRVTESSEQQLIEDEMALFMKAQAQRA